jgi:hypothetical protein
MKHEEPLFAWPVWCCDSFGSQLLLLLILLLLLAARVRHPLPAIEEHV